MVTGVFELASFGKTMVFNGLSLLNGLIPCQAVPASKKPTSWKLRQNEEVNGFDEKYLATGTRNSALNTAFDVPFRILRLNPRIFAAKVWKA